MFVPSRSTCHPRKVCRGVACPVGEDGRPRAEHGQRPAELLADLAEQGDPIYRKYHSLEDDIHIQTRHKRPTGNKKGGISAAIFYASDTLIQCRKRT